MSWINTLDDNRFLKTLFPNGAPLLDAIRLHEVQLHQDGPSVTLRLDLNEYPEEPPAKWLSTASNTVQIRLAGIGVEKFVIRGWASNNVGRLVIKGEARGVTIEFDAGECHMMANFDHLRIDSVTAYRDESR
jgi:hypothetical protein